MAYGIEDCDSYIQRFRLADILLSMVNLSQDIWAVCDVPLISHDLFHMAGMEIGSSLANTRSTWNRRNGKEKEHVASRSSMRINLYIFVYYIAVWNLSFWFLNWKVHQIRDRKSNSQQISAAAEELREKHLIEEIQNSKILIAIWLCHEQNAGRVVP